MPELAPPIAVTPHEWEILQDILHRFSPAQEVWAFGSRAQFTAKPYSDLDIALVNAVAEQFPTSASVMADLRNAFSSSDLPYKVDIVDWSSISDEIKRIIEGHRILIFYS
jgi:type I restriction enzyme S subunit